MITITNTQKPTSPGTYLYESENGIFPIRLEKDPSNPDGLVSVVGRKALSIEFLVGNWSDNLVPASEVELWKSVATELAVALEQLDALYRSEQDSESPVSRPEWLRKPFQRYHREFAAAENQSARRVVDGEESV